MILVKLPLIQICKELIDEGAILAIHDPKVEEKNICNALKEINRERWEYVIDLDSAFKNADAIVILTEWQDYANLKWGSIAIQMRKPSWLFDARSIVNPSELKNTAINFWRIGDGSI